MSWTKNAILRCHVTFIGAETKRYIKYICERIDPLIEHENFYCALKFLEKEMELYMMDDNVGLYNVAMYLHDELKKFAKL